MSNNHSIVKPTMQISLFTVIGFVINFSNQIIIASLFGSTTDRDALFVAMAVTAFVTILFVGSFGNVFLPHVIELQNNEKRDQFIISSIVIITLTLIATTIMLAIYSYEIASIASPGFTKPIKELTGRLIIYLSPSIVLGTLINMLSSLYYVRHRYVLPSVVPLFVSGAAFFTVVTTHSYFGILSVAIGSLLGSTIGFLMLLPIIFRSMRLAYIKNIQISKNISIYIRSSLPLFAFGAIHKSGNIYEKIYASGLTENSISYIGYASQIAFILTALTATGISISIYPLMSRLRSSDKHDEFRKLVNKITRIFFILTIPLAFYFFIYSETIIGILFERGAFTSETTLGVSSILPWYVFAMIVRVQTSLTSRILIIFKKTFHLSMVSLIELVVFIALINILCPRYSYIGIGMSWFISNLVNYLISLIIIKLRCLSIVIFKLYYEAVKITIIAILAIISSYAILFIVPEYLSNNNLLFHTFVLVVSYIFMCKLFKVAEIDEGLALVKTIINKYK